MVTISYQNVYYGVSFSITSIYTFVGTDSSSIGLNQIEESIDPYVEELKEDEIYFSYWEDFDFFIASLWYIDCNYHRRVNNVVNIISCMNLAYQMDNGNLDVA